MNVIEYIKSELVGCNNYVFIDSLLKEFEEEIKLHKYFDSEQFINYFNNKNIRSAKYPLSFLKNYVLGDIKNGRFDAKPNAKPLSTINALDLFNTLRSKGVEVKNEDTALIVVIEEFIITNDLLSLDELIYWNRQAVNYIASKENATTTDFIFLFTNTRKMREISLPMKKLQEKANEIIAEWNKAIGLLTAMSK